jgi:hypothetical protein
MHRLNEHHSRSLSHYHYLTQQAKKEEKQAHCASAVFIIQWIVSQLHEKGSQDDRLQCPSVRLSVGAGKFDPSTCPQGTPQGRLGDRFQQMTEQLKSARSSMGSWSHLGA